MGQPYLIKFGVQGFLLNLSLVFGLLSHVWFQPAERRHERLLRMEFEEKEQPLDNPEGSFQCQENN